MTNETEMFEHSIAVLTAEDLIIGKTWSKPLFEKVYRVKFTDRSWEQFYIDITDDFGEYACEKLTELWHKWLKENKPSYKINVR